METEIDRKVFINIGQIYHSIPDVTKFSSSEIWLVFRFFKAPIPKNLEEGIDVFEKMMKILAIYRRQGKRYGEVVKEVKRMSKLHCYG